MSSPGSRRRRSIDVSPPAMQSELIRLKEEFISLYDRHHAELQQSIEKLHGIMNKFEEDFKSATEGSRLGAIAGIAGGATVIAGIVLAPFTLGGSVALSAVGLAVSAGGAVGGGMFHMKKILQQKKLRKTMEEELKRFELTITPITDVLTKINRHTQELLRIISENHYGLLNLLFVSELVRFIRIEDIGEVAAQMSKAVRVTTAISGIFAGIGLVLDILSFLEDDKTLDDMNKLAGTHGQIDESEMKSKAGEFIVKMRKVITDLENIIKEIRNTRNQLANHDETPAQEEEWVLDCQ